jgi:hypothetical protein
MEASETGDDRLERRGNATKIFLAAAEICIAARSWATLASAQDPLGHPFARTESGLVIGSTTDGVNRFLGIPYAPPPVGALRWTPSKPYGAFPGFVLDGTRFGSECVQPGGIGSEDCLFLNVYTPNTDPPKPSWDIIVCR